MIRQRSIRPQSNFTLLYHIITYTPDTSMCSSMCEYLVVMPVSSPAGKLCESASDWRETAAHERCRGRRRAHAEARKTHAHGHRNHQRARSHFWARFLRCGHLARHQGLEPLQHHVAAEAREPFGRALPHHVRAVAAAPPPARPHRCEPLPHDRHRRDLCCLQLEPF